MSRNKTKNLIVLPRPERKPHSAEDAPRHEQPGTRFDVSLDRQEWALIRLIRQAGEGTIETLDYARGLPTSARTGFQTIRFDDQDQVARILAGDAVAVDMS